MASYTELRSLFNDSDLMERVEVAVIIAANDLAGGTPTAAQTTWIANAYSSPAGEARKALMGVLAANSGATLVNIQTASDATLQTNVDAIALILAAAG